MVILRWSTSEGLCTLTQLFFILELFSKGAISSLGKHMDKQSDLLNYNWLFALRLCLQNEKTELKSLPFPYKVAKALDPSIYRNIALDSWTEGQKGMWIILRWGHI